MPARTNISRKKKRKKRGVLGRMLRTVVLLVVMVLATYFGVCTMWLLAFNVITPPTTGVQLQRRVEAWIAGDDYEKRYQPVAPDQISRLLKHAVVAAEDGRFYQHGGIDWDAVQKAIEDNVKRGKTWRGGSTITQQLVKNLFMTTHSTYVRKGLEVPLTYLAEFLLTKDRILYLYLTVIEWDDGVYGAEAAARHYYGVSAAGLSRYQAAALAATIPNPRERSPQRMGWYTDIILRRMGQMGW